MLPAIRLIDFGFRQVVGLVPDAKAREALAKMSGPAIQLVVKHFTDHSQTLPKALVQANERAWQAVSIALAGDGFLDQIKRFFVSGDDKGIREQVRLFLQDKSIGFDGTPADFRQNCLTELNLAKNARLLTLSPKDVVDRAANLQRYADLKGMVDGAEQVVGHIADEFSSQYPNLAKLLRKRPSSGCPPLLVSAFSFFFRRAVETNHELAHGLFFDGLRQLSASQDKAFEQLDRIEDLGMATHTVVVETQEAILEIQAQVQFLVSKAGMQTGEVKLKDSCSIQSEEERTAVKHLLALFRQLPPEQQKKVPDLLNGLGKLQFGSGDFDGARQTFMEVAAEVDNPAAQAEAYFNAYRAALEKDKWDDALAAIQKAVSLDSQRFAPFPMQRYQAKGILGAGGFGTAFRCFDRFQKTEVVVKTFHDVGLGRSMDDVFREAHVLGELHHPAIIGVRDCNYADLTQMARPYIVMDYFPGVSLEQLIQESTLKVEILLVMARQIAQGLLAAHQQGILHRDIKPDNVLVRKDGDQWKVKIIDFGLAMRKQTIETSMVARSAGNTILSDSVAGTVKYAPPEQMGEMKGIKPGPYSDVYSFGKMCCHALFKTTEPKNRHWSSLPKELHEMLEKCTEQELEHRLSGFEPVIHVLEGLLQIQRTKVDEVLQEAGKAHSVTPVRQPGDIFTNSLQMDFAWIPPGTFSMGSPESEKGRRDDETQHNVALTKGFYMSIHTVSQEEWEAVMGNNPSSHTKVRKNLPVENISWYDCQEFIKRLRKIDNKPYRLATEAEWEYACRAGTTTPFHFGESTDFAFERRNPLPVGHSGYSSNVFGLSDMHGNVWEWCQDWYYDYSQHGVVDPQGPEDGERRVLRGGSWTRDFEDCRSAKRHKAEPVCRSDKFGFRLCFCLDATQDASKNKVAVSGGSTEQIVSLPETPRATTVPFMPKQGPLDLRAAQQQPKSPLAQFKPGEIISNSLGMKFAWIPPGTFVMGSPMNETERHPDETQHKVKLNKGFYMGIYAVTQEQWQAVMGNNPSIFKNDKNLPVEQISWEDCQDFIRTMRETEKKLYRLPTEAEWEYACRGGTTTPFHFGETITTDQANFDGSFFTYGTGEKRVFRQKTTPVGIFPANAFGLFDMHGNVWEWCQDWFGAYPENEVVDPQGPSKLYHRVLRGGSWNRYPSYCRSAYRLRYEPNSRYSFVGFRLCYCDMPDDRLKEKQNESGERIPQISFSDESQRTVSVPVTCKQEVFDLQAAQQPKMPLPQTKPGEILTNSLGMSFAWIPPGTFVMGSPMTEAKRSDDETQHKVTLSKGFYMGVHPVTQEQWQAVMGNNPSYRKGKKKNRPVEQVSWEDCQGFIKKLRDKDNKACRLPTEAEWEFACRAGTTTPFHIGETISSEQANYNGHSIYGNGKKGVYRTKTTPVGSFPANAWGLSDMHGNVWEWCQDWFGDYPQNDVVDPQGPTAGQFKVHRGGSWIVSPEGCRSACRESDEPGYRGLDCGLRVCFFVDTPEDRLNEKHDDSAKSTQKMVSFSESGTATTVPVTPKQESLDQVAQQTKTLLTLPKMGDIITNGLGMKFTWIPPGTFIMGSPSNEVGRESLEDQHKVTLAKGFYLGVNLVTQEEWRAIMGNYPSYFKGDKTLPVEQVSWDDCQEFIKKLRENDVRHYRLPTEDEWEYACRAGTTTPFCYGETISTDQANYNGDFIYANGKKGVYRKKTTRVGSFPANAWGLYDMHGNVFEWCQNSHQGYRVLRGGSWGHNPQDCRSAFRFRLMPSLRSGHSGLRVCFSVE